MLCLNPSKQYIFTRIVGTIVEDNKLALSESILPLTDIPGLVRPCYLAKPFPFVELKFACVPTAIAVLDDAPPVHHVMFELTCVSAILLLPIETTNACPESVLPLAFVAVAVFDPSANSHSVWDVTPVVCGLNTNFFRFCEKKWLKNMNS